MKHRRKIVAGISLLLAASIYFGTQQASKQGEQSNRKPSNAEAGAHDRAAAGETAQSRPGMFPKPIVLTAQATPQPSALAVKNFPKGKLLETRLEQLSANEFRRIEVIETSLKYPFIRLETRFRQNGSEEVLLGRHEVVADHVSVALMPEATEKELLEAIAPIGGSIRKKLNLEYAQTYLVGLPAATIDTVPDAIEHLRAFAHIVKDVDGDGVSRKAVIPNDSQFPQMWHHNNTGQNGGLYDSDIDTTEAWSIHTGSTNVIVAISDTGVNYKHNDLKGNIWTNTAERVNASDDNSNGYRDDVRGWNFYAGNKDTLDEDGHGTFVAGVIGARGNNSSGVAGIAWNCSIMTLRVLDTDGGFNSDIAEGFDYARRNGARIINASHGGTGTATMKAAVDNLEAAGVLLIAAAGNYAEDTDSIPLHPASYPNQNVISVAATGRGDSITSFSSYGATTVDLAAPGTAIYSTTKDNGYSSDAGTSFSAPLVAGVAALLQAQNPGWDCFQIRARILNQVDKVPNLEGKCVTGGRLNAYKALLNRVALSEALDNPNLTWSTSGAAPWFGGRLFSHDTVDCAEAGKIWNNQESRVQTTIAGPGLMYFWWKVSSEPNFDFLIFYVDGSEVARISGETAWAQRFYDLPAGNHTMTWRYIKDASQTGGKDTGFLDEVTFLGVPPSIHSQPASQSVFAGTNVTFTVSASGTAPFNYQWFKDGTALAGATRSVLTLNNVQSSASGSYSVRVSNRAGTTTSSAALLTVCNISLSSSSSSFSAAGGAGSFGITLAGSCSWTVRKTNSWVTFVSSATGSGNTTFHFSVAANNSSEARAGFLTVGNRRFLVRQSGVPAPDVVNGHTFSMLVTNASGPLPSAGTFLLTTRQSTEGSTFQLTPISEGVVTPDQGTASYVREGSSSATVNLAGNLSYTAQLTFTSAWAGTFNLAYQSGDSQSGFFKTRKAGLDLDGNSRNDLLLQNTDGRVIAWLMEGSNILSALPLKEGKPVATGWKVVAAADLMETAEPEIILQSSTGQLAAWCFRGTNFLKSVFLRNGTPLGTGWKVVSAADFNRDGQADLLLQHQDTRAAVWFMNGTNFLGAQRLREGALPGAGWRIAGSDDFDGDRHTDLLWQHQDGRLQVWHFVGSDFVAVSQLRTAGGSWRVVAINDFNEDGRNDLLFQNQERRLAVWYMDGTTFLGAALLRNGQPLSSSMRVAAPK